jgi:adhesin transport system outer membrane protein
MSMARTGIHAGRWLGTAALALALAGCSTPKSYVVLLPSPDGTVGKVVVQGKDGERMLTEANSALTLAGNAPAFKVEQERLSKDFGGAIQARPPLPETYVIFFVLDSTEPVPESRALLTKVLQIAMARETVDLSITGHTDTLGRAQDNEALGLRRANVIADQMRQLGMKNLTLKVQSHGERNPLVKTPDETAEPRNRRAEVTIR